MKIQLMSDLHLEFSSYEPSLSRDADVYVFAGDIHTGLKAIPWLEDLRTRKPIIYTLGNHELYRETYPKLFTKIKGAVERKNLFFLEREAIEIEGVTFHGCTLWTDFNLFGNPRLTGAECQDIMTDFKKIRRLPNYSKLRAIDVSGIHLQSKHWLSESLSNSQTQKNVVITHHAPSIRSVSQNEKQKPEAASYASHLDDFIDEHKPDLWLHGHCHNSSDYKIGECRVVCNPRGYAPDHLNSDFQDQLIIEI